MDISLNLELERLVIDKVKSGMYQTSSEVIREGLRLLKERDQRLESLRSYIREGFEAVDRGEFTDYDASNVRKIVEQVKARGRRRLINDVPKTTARCNASGFPIPTSATLTPSGPT